VLGPNEGYVFAMIWLIVRLLCALEPKDVPGKKFFFEDWFGFGPFMKKENFVAIRVRSGPMRCRISVIKVYILHGGSRIRVEGGLRELHRYA
jgi:hypothetical protein